MTETPAGDAPLFSFNSDRPAERAANDRLDVYPFVRRLAVPLLTAPREHSLVVALYAPWGYGKSTALYFLEEALEAAAGGQTTDANRHLPQPVVVRFTPWLYAGVEPLLASFFETLGTVIGDQPETAAQRKSFMAALKGMGEFVGPAVKTAAVFLPIPGGAVAAEGVKLLADLLTGAAKGSATALEGGEITFRERKREAARVLEHLAAQGRPQRVIVLVDDLDRAGPDEVLAMLKLVKLVADLPNVSYVVAMDRDRVVAALDRAVGPNLGGDFLEKIVQIGVHLPPFGPDRLSRFAVEGATDAARGAGLDAALLEVDWREWEIAGMDTYEVHLRRALRTPRDVVRLLNAYGFAVRTGEALADLDPVDLLLLCLLQTRFPAVYAAVRANRRFLLGQEHLGWRRGPDEAEGRKLAESERRRRLAEIAVDPGEGAAAIQSAVVALDPTPAVRMLERGQRPVALDILLELFPHCLGEQQGTRDAARERVEARICAPERFDGYFRLDPAPGTLQNAEIEGIFGTLVSPAFAVDDARTLAAEYADLGEDGLRSLSQGLADLASPRALPRDDARTLANSLPVLAGADDAGRRFPAGVVAQLAVLAAKRLRGRYAREDLDREAAPDADAALRMLLAVVRSLPADDAAELAHKTAVPNASEIELTPQERAKIAATGLTRAREALTAGDTRMAGAAPRAFSKVVWRCHHLADQAGEVGVDGRYPHLEEFVIGVLDEEPDRLSEVIALGAGWTGNGLIIPEGRSAVESIDRVVPVSRVYDLARAAVASGAVDRMRWPDLVRDFVRVSRGQLEPPGGTVVGESEPDTGPP